MSLFFKYDMDNEVNTVNMNNFMRNKFNFTIKEIKKYDELEKYFRRSDYLVLYYGEEKSPRYKMFKESAHDNQAVPFLHTDSANIQWK